MAGCYIDREGRRIERILERQSSSGQKNHYLICDKIQHIFYLCNLIVVRAKLVVSEHYFLLGLIFKFFFLGDTHHSLQCCPIVCLWNIQGTAELLMENFFINCIKMHLGLIICCRWCLQSYYKFQKIFKGKDGELSVIGRLAAGACAGMTSTFVSYIADEHAKSMN